MTFVSTLGWLGDKLEKFWEWFKNFIDKYNTTINEVEGYSFFKYQNDVKNFKDLIKKAIVSYNEFMFLLLECKGINNNNIILFIFYYLLLIIQY